jgi:hypothetical protein
LGKNHKGILIATADEVHGIVFSDALIKHLRIVQASSVPLGRCEKKLAKVPSQSMNNVPFCLFMPLVTAPFDPPLIFRANV